MSITIRRTKHLDSWDMAIINYENEAVMKLLSHKLIMRASDTVEGEKQIEHVFTWLKDNCKNFYSVCGPKPDKDTIKYFIYFVDEDEMLLFAASFPQHIDEYE